MDEVDEPGGHGGHERDRHGHAASRTDPFHGFDQGHGTLSKALAPSWSSARSYSADDRRWPGAVSGRPRRHDELLPVDGVEQARPSPTARVSPRPGGQLDAGDAYGSPGRGSGVLVGRGHEVQFGIHGRSLQRRRAGRHHGGSRGEPA